MWIFSIPKVSPMFKFLPKPARLVPGNIASKAVMIMVETSAYVLKEYQRFIRS